MGDRGDGGFVAEGRATEGDLEGGECGSGEVGECVAGRMDGGFLEEVDEAGCGGGDCEKEQGVIRPRWKV